MLDLCGVVQGQRRVHCRRPPRPHRRHMVMLVFFFEALVARHALDKKLRHGDAGKARVTAVFVAREIFGAKQT